MPNDTYASNLYKYLANNLRVYFQPKHAWCELDVEGTNADITDSSCIYLEK